MGTRNNKSHNFSIIYKKEIEWLKWYFTRDKLNSTKSILETKIDNCKTMNDLRSFKKFSTIKKVIDNTVAISDADLLKAVKEVYVFRRMSVIGAAQSILFLSQTQAYVHIKRWFIEFEMQLFDLMIE
ncbi:hypothetical protein MXZ34_03355 [Streptococcus uberis]|uniref:hypothetical protein n=1 Tax=Streptococcus uberis TaxID=1349 RepID=UPI001FF6EF8C|nr:hypothetical protein [Streptococcus uberis]MCK1166909.1 hypothetical protein [Streptococcus uberis]